MIKDIQNQLSEKFKGDDIQIIDFSSEHAGHGPHVKTASHLKIYITSALFAGKTKVAQQQMVHHILKPFFKTGLHAVELYLKEE